MMDEPKYKRVLLKISGEALAGDKHFGLDFQVMGQVADVIRECVAMGVQVGIVIGGGNFWRGVKNGEAVSYTHLDVYKRQGRCRPRRRTDTVRPATDGSANPRCERRLSCSAH